MNDRRHELQNNELAMRLDRINQAIEPHSRLIAIVVGALIIAGIAWMFYSSKQTGDRSYSTLGLIESMDSGDAEELADVSTDFPGTIAGDWAKMFQANQYLAKGVDGLFADRDAAVDSLGDAKTAFTRALEGATDPLLISRAHLGLARTHESLGETEEAISEYKKTIAAGESKAMIQKAEDRIAVLSKPATQDFMAWFADQDFNPADPSLPPSLPGSESLPDLPDLDFSDIKLPTSSLPGGENSKVMDSDEGLELPADEEAVTTEAVTTEAATTETEAAGDK